MIYQYQFFNTSDLSVVVGEFSDLISPLLISKWDTLELLVFPGVGVEGSIRDRIVTNVFHNIDTVGGELQVTVNIHFSEE